jgi:lysophospholipase L1-like esterase
MLHVRAGIPAFAQRIRAGNAATIVAFGTSITMGGHYLAPLTPALTAATGNAGVRLINSGLRGFVSIWGAFRVRECVLAHQPDLVLLEFAHNEAEGVGRALDSIGPGMDGIIAQIRAGAPDCEIVFVYLAQQGVAAAGPSPAMLVHETIAEYYGFPSIDLATLTETLVAAGTVSWDGNGAPALTTDGVHHTALAQELLGRPFASAFIELMRASTTPRPPPPPIRDPRFSRAWRVPASRYLAGGSWATGIPKNHESRNAEAYAEDVAVASATDAVLRLEFAGAQAFVWAAGAGTLRVSEAGRAPFLLDVAGGEQWNLYALTPDWDDGGHTIEVAVTKCPVVLGDLFLVGSPGGAPTK